MLVLSFLTWWYGPGWKKVANSFTPRFKEVMVMFSVSQLARTLFAPWRRIISYPGASLADRFRAWGDNMVSRVIGFVVRLTVLITAFFVLFVVGLLTAAEVVIWPLMPIAVPGFLIAGIIV